MNKPLKDKCASRSLILPLILVMGMALLVYVLMTAFDLRELRNEVSTIKSFSLIEETEEKVSMSKIAYAQLSSDVTQRATSDKPAEMQMRIRGTIHNIGFDPKVSTTDIKILHDGVYFLMASPQVGRLSADNSKPTCVNFFFTVNNKPLNDSNVTMCLPNDPFAKDVVVTQNIHPLHAGDELSIMIATTNAEEGIGIEALSPEDQPVIPSVMFTMFRLGDIKE